MFLDFVGHFYFVLLCLNLTTLGNLSFSQTCTSTQSSLQSFIQNSNICPKVELNLGCDNDSEENCHFLCVKSVKTVSPKRLLGNTKESDNDVFYSNSYDLEQPVQVAGFENEKTENHYIKQQRHHLNLSWMNDLGRDTELSGPCNIEKLSKGMLNQKKFLELYAFEKPVIIVNATDNKEFQELTKFDKLLQIYGQTKIKLSSANSFSYENKIVTFEEYCHTHLQPQSLSTLGNETFYFFGDNSNEDWFDLMKSYNFPSYFLPGYVPQGSFGIAGQGSGVPFHFHGPGFAETLWGRKRWFMYPPKSVPPFHPNRTTLQWLHEEYTKARLDSDFMECTLNPGELIYFPDHWWHATLNVDTAVFMSTFLSSYGP